MCGIVGIASRTAINPRSLEAAILSLGHRGPDGCGVYVSPSGLIGFGHTRLAIIDLSSAAQQPMRSQDGHAIVTFNGEIYNYLALRKEFSDQGYNFKSNSDTEVLLAGYLICGTEILQKLNGIFAFAIHDTRRSEIFLARDQMGVKPIYYTSTEASFAFASEIKALLHLVPLDRTLDLSAIRRYLTFLWCPGGQTPFAHVKKLAPGSAMIIRDGMPARTWTYWEPPLYQPRRNWNVRDCVDELQSLLETCVHRQMVSDAPVGALLSGGLDSSAIVAAARRWQPEMDCFTIELDGGADEGNSDDLPYAREVAAHLKVPLSEVRVSARTMCDRAVEMVGILDEPIADPACLNVLFISELARSRGIKVLLSGAGGDDLFTGYRRHTLLSFDPVWGKIPISMRRRFAELASGFDRRRGWTRKLSRILEVSAEEGDRRVVSSFMWGPALGVNHLLSIEVREKLMNEDVAGPLMEQIEGHPDLPAIEKCLMLDKRFFLADHNLIYTDKMAMAAGVEVRVPFLDLEMLQFAAEIPVKFKHKFMRAKWILKESQRDVLPSNVIDRPKTGFGAPLRRWIKGGMLDLLQDLLSRSSIIRRGLFDPAAVQKLLNDDKLGRVDASYTLFSLMCIELWCRQFVDAPSPSLANRA